MLDLLYIIVKLFFMANLSVLLLLYFPARFAMSCCLRVRHENPEKLNDLSPYVYYVLGGSILFVTNGFLSSISASIPLYVLSALGLIGLSLEIYKKNTLFDKENIRFLMFFSIIFLLCIGQFILHSLGHDEWFYFEVLRSYQTEGVLPIKPIAGYNLPSYGLLIPSLYVLSLNSFPLMPFTIVLVQALLLTVLFVSICGGITKFKKSDLLVVFLLLTHSYVGNFAAHQVAFLIMAVTLVLFMSGFARDPSVQILILLLMFLSPLVHHLAMILSFFVFIMVVLAGRVNFKPFVVAVVIFAAVTTTFLSSEFGRHSMPTNWNEQRFYPQQSSQGKEKEKEKEIEVVQAARISGSHWVEKFNALYNICYIGYIGKNGNWRLAELSLIYFTLLFFGKRIYS